MFINNIMKFFGEDMLREIEASQKNFIKSSPTYSSFDFASNMQKKFANRKSAGRNPFPSGSQQTLYPDPLYTGNLRHFKTFGDYNNRDNCEGGAMLYDAMPKGGEMSDSSEDEYSSGDDEDEEGSGLYDEYIVPFGKTLGNVGKHVFTDVVIPIGKEVLKEAVMAKLGGDHECGGLGASKAEYVKMLGKINGRYGVKEEHLKKMKARDLKKILMHNDPEALAELSSAMEPRQRKARKDKGQKRQKYEKIDFGIEPENVMSMDEGGLVGTKSEFKKILGEMFPHHKLPKQFDKLDKQQMKDMILADVDKMDKIGYDILASQSKPKARKPRAKKVKESKEKKPRTPRAKKLPEGIESVVEIPSKKRRAMDAVKALISPPSSKKKSAMDAVKALISSPVAKAPRAKRTPSKRNDIVKQVMAQQGLSMIQASKYVKENGLY